MGAPDPSQHNDPLLLRLSFADLLTASIKPPILLLAKASLCLPPPSPPPPSSPLPFYQQSNNDRPYREAKKRRAGRGKKSRNLMIFTWIVLIALLIHNFMLERTSEGHLIYIWLTHPGCLGAESNAITNHPHRWRTDGLETMPARQHKEMLTKRIRSLAQWHWEVYVPWFTRSLGLARLFKLQRDKGAEQNDVSTTG